MRYPILALLLFACGCPQQGWAQIKVSEEKSIQFGGFDNPRIVNGVVIADATSKPFPAKTDSRLLLVLDPGYTLKDIEIEAVPSLEFVQPTLTTIDGKTELKINGTGRFRARAELELDGKKVISRFNFAIGDPAPVPPPTPPDPPKPNADIRNEYGLGLPAYQNAPDAATSKSIAKTYRAAADSLYAQNGQPLRFVQSDDARANADPNRNVILWLNGQLAGAKPEFKLAVAAAFKESQSKRQFKREDWYAAFVEIADALERVK